MKNFPNTITDRAISIFFDGKMHNIPSSNPNFKEIKQHLMYEDHDEKFLRDRINRGNALHKYTSGSDIVVDVDKRTITYKGEEIHGVLVDKLLSMASTKANVGSLVEFLKNLEQNPSFNSRQSLYAFLENWMAPITEDGCFIAFKNVTKDFKDIYSRTFDNRPGKVVEVPRSKVDDNINNTCSRGLHVAATSYLKHFYASGSRTVAVKVNPRDVVAVPPDYKNAKMRCCRYEVLSEVTNTSEIEDQVIYNEKQHTFRNYKYSN